MSYFELSSTNPQCDVLDHFICVLYGERKDIEEYYKDKKCILKIVDVIGSDDKSIEEGVKPAGTLYKIIHTNGLNAKYIMTSSEVQAEKIYTRHCIANVVKPLSKGDYLSYNEYCVTKLVQEERLVFCIRENGALKLVI